MFEKFVEVFVWLLIIQNLTRELIFEKNVELIIAWLSIRFPVFMINFVENIIKYNT